MLTVEDLHSGYGPVRVLHGIDITVEAGEVVSVLGSNGAGKSTLMKTLVGLVPATAGSVTFDGKSLKGQSTEAITRLGMTLVPEGRHPFAKLSVSDNLKMGAYARKDRQNIAKDLADMMERFPILGERSQQLAGTLSGGEQQQLVICRALMSQPRLILLDEPSLGLAPVMVDRVFELVRELRTRDGLTVLLVEQSITHALEISDRAYVLTQGNVTASGRSDEMTGAIEELENSYLGGKKV